MKRKYLDEINVTERPDLWEIDDKHKMAKWEKQREEIGFDDRELWSLDYTFLLWLYERLVRFKDVVDNFVDLSYWKFNYLNKEYTQEELINLMIGKLELYFSNNLEHIERIKCSKEIAEIWAIVLPVMWY